MGLDCGALVQARKHGLEEEFVREAGVTKRCALVIVWTVWVLMLPVSSVSGAGKPGLAQEWVQFDRAIFDTGTQNSGAILQDKDGFLWVGTNGAGLFRYDGYDLKVYKPGGANSLSSPYVYALYEDWDGVIWIGTGGGGLNRYDKETDTFTQYKNDPQNPGSISSDLVEFSCGQIVQEDQEGKLWVGTQGGLNVLDKSTGAFKHYFHDPDDPNSLSHDNICALLFDEQGILWIGTKGGGLNRLDPQTGIFTRYTIDPADPQKLGGEWVTSLAQDDEGMLWVATLDNGLYKLDRATGIFAPYLHDPQNPNSPRGNKITSVYRDPSGLLWIMYTNGDQLGLSVFDPRTKTFTHYTHDPENASSLSSTSPIAMYQDRAGILWILNNTGLVDKLDPRKPRFTLYRHDPKNPNSLSDDAVVPVFEDRQGKIWIGTINGLQTYDKQTGIFTTYDQVYYSGIYEDQAGTLWLGGAIPASLHIFDRGLGKIVKTFTHDPQNPRSLANSRQIFGIIGDNHDPDILWMGTTDAGLERFQISTETFTHYQHDPQNPNSLSNNTLQTAIYQDGQGMLWIPTSGGGLDRFDPRAETFTHFRYDPQNPASLSSDTVNVVFEDASGMLWIGTAAGFDSFDRKTQTFKRYTEDTGYPVSMIASINQDADGNLWMGSLGGDGLIKFDPKTGAMRVYKESDGLQGNVFYPLNGIRDRDGMMWFGGSKGLNAFYPQEIQDNTYVPPVVITALKQGGEPLPLGKAPERVREITLDWQHNYFEFEFAALNFTQAQKNQYRYMLEGLDKDWFNAGTRRFGRYSGLHSGEYTLHILGSNNDGVWNEQGVSIKVRVVPPWWETWWFYALAITGALGIVLFIYRSRGNQIRTLRAAALALQESEKKYRGVIENIQDVFYRSDIQGRLLMGSPSGSRMFGYDSVDEMIGKPLDSFWVDPNERQQLLARIKAAGSVRDYEVVLRRKDGTTFNASFTTHFYYDDHGNLLGTEGIIRDITERKRAEEEVRRLNEDLERRVAERTVQLEAANKELEAFSYSVSHDLRAPLRAMDGYSRLLMEDYAPQLPSEAEYYLQAIRKSSQQMERLIDDLLAFSRLSRQALNKQAIATADLVGQVLADLRTEQEGRRVEISVGELPPCQADMGLLRQVWMNLLSNALKYTSKRQVARVEIGSQEQDGETVYYVRDNGTGFDMRYAGKLFGVFQRLHRADEYEGTGVGLAIVQRIVQRHGGRVWAEAEVDRGATFYFTI